MAGGGGGTDGDVFDLETGIADSLGGFDQAGTLRQSHAGHALGGLRQVGVTRVRENAAQTKPGQIGDALSGLHGPFGWNADPVEPHVNLQQDIETVPGRPEHGIERPGAV